MKYLSWKSLPINAKLFLMVSVVLAGVLALVIFVFAPEIERQMLSDKKEKLKNLVETVQTGIEGIYKQSQSGAITEEDAKTRIIDLVNATRYQGKEYYFICDTDIKIVTNPIRPQMAGKDASEIKDADGLAIYKEFVKASDNSTGGYVFYRQLKPGDPLPKPKLSYVKKLAGWNWIIGTGIYIDDLDVQVADFKQDLYINLAIFIFFAYLIAYLLASRISKNISLVSAAADKVSQGDFDIVIDIKSDDEAGRLAKAFNSMVAYIKTSINEINEKTRAAEKASLEYQQAQIEIKDHNLYLERNSKRLLEQMQKFAKGDLTIQLEPEKKDEIGDIFIAFSQAVQALHGMISDLYDTITTSSDSTKQISASTEEVSIGAQSLMQQSNEIASAIEEMTSTISENASNATKAAKLSEQALSSAGDSRRIVKETVDGIGRISEVVLSSANTIEELGKSSSEIGEIIQVINDIADQTNLLALNAAIEAARAGEQGRGFAVVADEVRKLAERTTKATKEIAQMIKRIQQDTAEAVTAIANGKVEVERGKGLVLQADASLQTIMDQTSTVSSMITMVADANEQQFKASEDVSKAIIGISNVAEESVSAVNEIARSISDLSSLASTLQEIIDHFIIHEHQSMKPASRLQSPNIKRLK